MPKPRITPTKLFQKVKQSIQKELKPGKLQRIDIEYQPPKIPEISVVEIPKIKAIPDPKRQLWRQKRSWQKKYAVFAQRQLKYSQARKVQVKVLRERLKKQAGPYPKEGSLKPEVPKPPLK